MIASSILNWFTACILTATLAALPACGSTDIDEESRIDEGAADQVMSTAQALYACSKNNEGTQGSILELCANYSNMSVELTVMKKQGELQTSADVNVSVLYENSPGDQDGYWLTFKDAVKSGASAVSVTDHCSYCEYRRNYSIVVESNLGYSSVQIALSQPQPHRPPPSSPRK